MTSHLTLTGAIWRKSSYSGQNAGNCVEVAHGVPGTVPVRDSKTPSGPVFSVSPRAWSVFVTALKDNAPGCS
ncbi:DUF397 domain-containing protein [Streptomyces sp. MUM 203J]|uniref:DUF397 domain-containing protein n=1 Tax=Streptomyces sp. MUM 203J TaxID=2791990 RepID=UPI001F039B6F|nr:DUF397 domain-containing protein [Streptomyces sp. MUM 203J]MCH0539000.1 DUF397 domain-containing protein [Streptomyces sp. MUM 203J]